MRVLWFTNNTAGYNSTVSGYNGGGWITSLKEELVKLPDIELGISFFLQGEPFNVRKENVEYYPISLKRSLSARFKRYFHRKSQIESHIAEFIKVLADFNPDLIHVFGSERTYGLIAQTTDVPTIIHLQGLLIPYLNAFVPPFYSKWDVFRLNGLNPLKLLSNFKDFKGWERSAKREKQIFAGCNYFMGRTEWDKRISKLYSPKSQYFYCSEMLRESFYNAEAWQINTNRDKIIIVTTISSPLYKGADMLLKTARILKEELKLSFEWLVYGISDIKFASCKTGIEPNSVSVFLKGIASAEELIDALINCDVCFHPSYIDNSPNSVCEAQFLGVPTLACNVGGVSSLIDHLKSGILIPANDPFIAASYIDEIVRDIVLASSIGLNARIVAKRRHDKKIILNDLVTIYRTIKKA